MAEVKQQKRPLTASKTFSISQFSNDTFKPFSIGRNLHSPISNMSSSPTNQQVPGSQNNNANSSDAAADGTGTTGTKHISRASSRMHHQDYRSTPKPPLKIPQRPNTAASHVSKVSVPGGTLLANVDARKPQPTETSPDKSKKATESHLTSKQKARVEKEKPEIKTNIDILDKEMSQVTVQAPSTDDAIWETYHRHQVPHDYHVNRYSHTHYCRGMLTGHPAALPHTMLTKNIAFSSRHTRTTFGKSNRLEFLRQVFLASGPKSVLPPYPASYHGTGGEGKEYALGLTVAGTAGDSRILRPSYSYSGVKDIPNRKYPETKLGDLKLPDLNPTRESRLPDPTAPRHMREILHLDGGHWKEFHLSHPQVNVSNKPHTRYESNKEWSRQTGTMIQAPSHFKHFHISEQERFAHVPYVDEETPKRKRDYEKKIKHFVRDKNVNTIRDLLSPSQA